MNTTRIAVTLIFLPGLLLLPLSLSGQAFNDFQIPPHSYGEIECSDAMSRLLGKVDAGGLDFEEETGTPLLRRLLAELSIPETSQILLFSQTSLQKEYISPKTPRAIYFNENGYVTWVPDGLIEVLMFDPDAGGVFFIEELPEDRPDRKTAFVRGKGCTGCHGGVATNFLPGPMARSAYVTEEGKRISLVAGHTRMHHGVPITDRWGGYYVSGAPASLGHLGNTFASREGKEMQLKRPDADVAADLGGLFESKKYLRPDSNVLALLLFDHQIEAHNLLMELRYRWRLTEYEKAKESGGVSVAAREGLERGLNKFVRYLLFANEAPLDGSSIDISEDFHRDFKQNARRDGNGHSLKDLNLSTRLFTNRLSYMIYAQAFAEAPAGMRAIVYERLHSILTSPEPPEGFGFFEPGERARIVSILRATKDDLPELWNTDATLANYP